MYIDTSVLVAYYLPEAGSDAVQKTLRALDRPTISSLVEVELVSALNRKVRTGELDAADAGTVTGRFDVHLADNRYAMVPVTAREYRVARDWMAQFTHPLRTLDALHLATAFSNGLTILTADEGLIQCGRDLGVAVASP